jgi:hypothetical protein
MVLMSLASRRRRDENGTVAVIVGLSVTLLCVLAAMVIDLGHARDVRRQSQNSSDAAALAAAVALYPENGECTAANPSLTMVQPCFTDAVNAAKAFALRNFGVSSSAWAACVDPGAYWAPPGSPCISFTDDSLATTPPAVPTKVRVLTPTKDVDTSLGTVAGVSKVSVNSAARATFTLLTSQPCALCVLGTNLTHNFQNGDAQVNGGDIYLNGNSDVSNNGLVASDGNIYVQGTAGGSLSDYDPDPQTGQPAIQDPLASTRLPNAANSWLGATAAGKTDPCTDGPGIYAGWSVSNAVCTLQPGLYVVASGQIKLSGNATTALNGTGVSIFLACGSGNVPHDCAAAGEKGASIDASGGGNIGITAPATGDIVGVAIAADRHNIDPASNQPLIRLTGDGTLGMAGAIYARSATVQMNGNGCTNGTNAMIVSNDIAFNGNNSCLTLNYSVGQNPVPMPLNLHLDQ